MFPSKDAASIDGEFDPKKVVLRAALGFLTQEGLERREGGNEEGTGMLVAAVGVKLACADAPGGRPHGDGRGGLGCTPSRGEGSRLLVLKVLRGYKKVWDWRKAS